MEDYEMLFPKHSVLLDWLYNTSELLLSQLLNEDAIMA